MTLPAEVGKCLKKLAKSDDYGDGGAYCGGDKLDLLFALAALVYVFHRRHLP